MSQRTLFPFAPQLETSRLILRAHEARDLDAVAALWSDVKVVRYISSTPSTRTESWARILRYAGLWPIVGYGYWAVEEKATGCFIGDVGLADFARDLSPPMNLAPEAGWALTPAVHGMGYATEAVQAVLSWADTFLDAARVTCLLGEANTASLNVARKCGFHECGYAHLRGSHALVWARPRCGKL